MNTVNRRPNLVIRRKPPTKEYSLWSILAILPLKLSSKQASNLTRLTNPLPRKIRMPKRYRSPQRTLIQAYSENVLNGLEPAIWRTSKNSPEFTSSLTPKRMRKGRPARHINSTKSAARPWQMKRGNMINFGIHPALTMT